MDLHYPVAGLSLYRRFYNMFWPIYQGCSLRSFTQYLDPRVNLRILPITGRSLYAGGPLTWKEKKFHELFAIFYSLGGGVFMTT